MAARDETQCTILLVDDEPANLDLLEDFLREEGYQAIIRSEDSREAIALFDASRPDLVLLDLHMPHVSGYEVLEAIQERSGADDFVPVVILTADVSPTTRTRALEAGAHDFLTKPLDVVEVKLRVRNHLRTRLSHLEQRVARQAAEAATRAREMVLSVVAHDLRNPLASITMDAEMVRHLLSEEEHAEQLRSIVRIEQTAARMHALIEDLLEVVRLEHGTFAIHMAQVAPVLVFQEAEEMLMPIARSRGIDLCFAGPTDLARIHADGQRLVQVLSNVVGNAVKFTPAGGTVEVRWCAEGGELRVSVRDTGPGIPPEQLQRVFDFFWQGGGLEGHGGIGLGLVIARAIVEAHNGRIWLESEVGVGTTVHFVIPMDESAGEPIVALEGGQAQPAR